MQGALTALTAVLLESTSPSTHHDVLQAMCNLTAVQPPAADIPHVSNDNVVVSDKLSVPAELINAVAAFACSQGACRDACLLP